MIENAQQYWELIQKGNIPDPTWITLQEQLKVVFANDEPIPQLIQTIADLPFPKELGLCDSQQYDTFVAGVILGLVKVHLDTTGELLKPPYNAPQPGRTVQNGRLSWIEGGSARAETAANLQYREEKQKSWETFKKMDTTEACKAALVTQFTDTKPADWKRLKKFTQEGRVLRTFCNKTTAQEATVIFDEDNDDLELEVCERLYQPSSVAGSPKGTGTAVKFHSPAGKYRSGNIYFALGGNQHGAEIDFYCGPESAEGALDDQNDQETTDVLEALFPDYKAEWDAAENYHVITLKPGQSIEELQNVLRERITAAGGIEHA